MSWIMLVESLIHAFRLTKDENGMWYVCEEHKFMQVSQLLENYMKNASGLVCKLAMVQKPQQVARKGGPVNSSSTIDRNDIKYDPSKKMGRGFFGTVYKGEFQGKEVGIKEVDDESAIYALKQDGSKIIGLEHKNVLKIHGVCDDGNWLVVMDFCAKGNLKQMLQRESKGTFSSSDLKKYATSCLNGMAYLESKSILHRDLRCCNLLINQYNELKVSDYGLAAREDIEAGDLEYPCKWTAPEPVCQQLYTSKSDVWMFGVTVWEVFSHGAEPYPKLDPKQIYTKVFEEGFRLRPPPECPDDWAKLMPKFWMLDPAKRPSFALIKQTLGV